MPRFAISDIHGCNKTFEALLNKISFNHQDTLYILGDCIDRGPNSKGVLKTIRQLRKKEYKVHTLLGNHEKMLLNAYTGKAPAEIWISNGGREALQSFGVNYPDEIPTKYIHLIQDFKYHILLDDYILVHAGLNFKKEDIFADEQAKLWIRDWYKDINYAALKGRTIVHGHTPIQKQAIERALKASTPLYPIDIDCGCAYYNKPNMGYLCALNLDTRQATFQKNVEFK